MAKRDHHTTLSIFLTLVLVALSPASLVLAQQRRATQPQRATPSTKQSTSTPAVTSGATPAQTSAGIPAHPKDLKYSPLEYSPPKRDKYRRVLSNGAVAYLVEDHDLPLVNVSVMVRTGSYLEPAGREGLAFLTGGQIRAGGTTTKKAGDFDEAADFLAATISSFVGDTQG
nr:hypothetical protein [Pyrinomonadaceae bacterium]